MLKKGFYYTIKRFYFPKNYGISPLINENAFKNKTFPELGEKFVGELKKKEQVARSSFKFWRNFMYGSIVFLLVATIPVAINEMDEIEHRKQMRKISDDDWETYAYMNIIRKNFFFGDGKKTLFWNDDVNRIVERV